MTEDSDSQADITREIRNQIQWKQLNIYINHVLLATAREPA